jgi:hypothetical protein
VWTLRCRCCKHSRLPSLPRALSRRPQSH